MMLAGWILDANWTHLGMREFPPPQKKISKNWHLWPGYVTPDHCQSSAKQPIALGECRERCRNRESHIKRHSQETCWLRSKPTFMVPALKACMQQTCLFYRGRELQAQRGEQQTHVWKGCCSNCTAVYSFFNVLCLRHDLALNIVIMILKKNTFTYFLPGGVEVRRQFTEIGSLLIPRGSEVSESPCLTAAAFTHWDVSQAIAPGKFISLHSSAFQKALSPHIWHVLLKIIAGHSWLVELCGSLSDWRVGWVVMGLTGKGTSLFRPRCYCHPDVSPSHSSDLWDFSSLKSSTS